MTKTLTEHWREGTLPKDLYYTSSSNGRKGVSFHTGSKRHMFSPYDKMAHQVEEVLALVPSYDKVKEMSQKIARLEFDNEALGMAHNEGKEINAELVSKTEQLEKKLEIATKALQYYAGGTLGSSVARQALKEMEGVK